MPTEITLGNFTRQNGRTVLNGSQSGLDTEALINGIAEARRLPAVRLEARNETLGTQRTALASLQSLLTRFRTSVDTLRNPPGVLNASQNIFEYRTATLSSVLAASNHVSVTVEPGTNTQSLTINKIEQLAQETKQETGSILAVDANAAVVAASGDATVGRFSAGTFGLRVLDGGAAASITLTETDSLNSIASKFNAVKERTGIQATVLKVANGTPNSSFKIIFTGTKTGVANGFDLENISTVTSDPDGALNDIIFAPRQVAQNAKFTLDGVEIERESNTVADLISGITFTLKQPFADTTPITLGIEPDRDIVTNAVNSFADVYNELRVFFAKQNELGDDGLPTEDAVLAGNATLRTVVNAVADEINSVVAGLASGSPASLSELGINFQNFEGDEETPATTNIIVIDAQRLQSSLQANFDGLRDVFEFNLTSDNNNLAVFKRSNALAVTSFTLNLDRANNVYTATHAGGTEALDFTQGVDGVITLKGRAGTVFAGLELIYASTADATINVSVSQGIADRLFNELDTVLATNGLLPTSLQSIEDQTQRNETEITKLDEFIVRLRERLVDQYSALEAALSRANQLLTLLDSQQQARNNA